MYRVKLYHLRRNVKFVIMNSVYYTDKYLQTFYDLKGSVLGREAKPGQAVKKDNDLRAGFPHSALALPPETKGRVRGQLKSDCDFLEECSIMDYSMLVGVHHIPHDSQSSSLARKGFHASSQRLSFGGGSGETGHLEMLAGLKTDDSVEFGRRNDGNGFLDDGLDDDESSYLVGSKNRKFQPLPSFDLDMEQKKYDTIEKLYWPFHKLFDIHGYRILEPIYCTTCKNAPCNCPDDPVLANYKIPNFVAPLSDRKDGGFEMDTSGYDLPIRLSRGQACQGKIFYMGVIDILQEYTSRKQIESMYRSFQLSGQRDASCVPPDIYGIRFLNFFDEYSVGPTKDEKAQKRPHEDS